MDGPRPLEVDIEVPFPDFDVIFARKLMDNPYVEKLNNSYTDLNISGEIEESYLWQNSWSFSSK